MNAPTDADALRARSTTPTMNTALADIRDALAIIESGAVEVVGAPRYQLDSTEILGLREKLVEAETKLELAARNDR